MSIRSNLLPNVFAVFIYVSFKFGSLFVFSRFQKRLNINVHNSPYKKKFFYTFVCKHVMARTIPNQTGDQNFIPGQRKFTWSITDNKGNTINNVKYDSSTWKISLNPSSKFCVDSEDFFVDKQDIVNNIVDYGRVKLVALIQLETLTILKFKQFGKI